MIRNIIFYKKKNFKNICRKIRKILNFGKIVRKLKSDFKIFVSFKKN